MCQFSIPFSSDAEGLIGRAKQQIEKAGGSFTGDASMGKFEASTPIGSIVGSYQIEGQEIALSISKKPFLLSCAKIEKELTAVMS
ncbi:MAG: hypothetical protein M3040_00425 [Bacteroidota bacterium]|nr:hypothetical protein [Bacteroidota bacterium]